MTDPTLSNTLDHDPSALDRLRRFGGDKLLSEMIDLFLAHAGARLQAARSALDAGDVAGVRTSLHALKSSAAQLGAVRLSARCADGEALSERGSTAGLSEIIAAADADLHAAGAWLTAARRGATPSDA